MRARRFSEEQILHLWHQAERGEQPIGALCREHGISAQRFYRWRQKFGGRTVPDTQRLRALERENARLKRLLAERDLEVDALTGLLAKKSCRWRPAAGPSHCWSPGGSRRACVLRQLPRSTFGYRARPERHTELTAQLHALARRPPRDGDRRVWALRRRRGQHVNKQQVHRLWTQAKRQVRKATRQRGPARPAMVPVQATPPDQVWTDDCLHDRCRNGTPLKVLTVMDEFTREGLAIGVATSWPSPRVLAVLEPLVATHGAPRFMRRDNGPECSALAMRGWLAQHQMTTRYITPGCPWQNGYGERCNGTVRDECLNLHVFQSVAEARVMLDAYRRPYHEERPHCSLGYRPPAEFKRAWLERQS